MATLVTKHAISIEIRWHAIGVASGRPGRSSVESMATTGPGTPDDWQGLQDTLQTLSGAGGVSRVGLPPEEFMIRSLLLPFRDPRRIRMVLPMELEPLVPDPVDDLAISYITEPVENGTQVLAAAIPKERLHRYESTLEAAGLGRARLITIGGAAAGWATNPSDVNRLVVQRVADSLTVYAVSARGIVGARTIPVPTDSDEYQDDAPLPLLRQVMAGIQTSVPTFKPERVILMGGPVQDPHSTDALEASLNLPVTLLETGPNPDSTLVKMADALAAARGKWPHWNFQRPQRPMIQVWRHHRRHVIAISIALFLLAMVGATNYGSDIYFLRKQNAKLDKHLENIYRRTFPNAPRMPFPQNMVDMKNRVEKAKKSDATGKNGTVPVRVVDILAMLATTIPSTLDVSLTRLTVEGARLTVAGVADNFNTVDSVRDRLAQSGQLTEATIVSAEQDGQSKQVRFSLKAKVTP